MKIYAPVKDANGVYASVRFVNGVGETDNPRLIAWFKSHGYRVPIEDECVKIESDPIDTTTDESVVVEDEPELMGYAEKQPTEPNFEEMTPLELREWATANGLGHKIKNTRSREKLLEIIRRG